MKARKQLEMRYREHSPLAELLDRPYIPPQRISGIIRRPAHLMPDRLQLIDYMLAKYDYVPSPDLDIEYRTIFYKCRVPVSGKLFVDCGFIDCEFEKPEQPYAAIGCMTEGPSLYWHAQRYGNATITYCVGRDFNGR